MVLWPGYREGACDVNGEEDGDVRALLAHLHSSTRTGVYSGALNWHTDIKEAAFWSGAAAPVWRDLRRRLDGSAGKAGREQRDTAAAALRLGRDGWVVAGSDDGRVFIWDAQTSILVGVLEGDADIVNCVRPHPTLPALAVSGIESEARLFTSMGNTPRRPVDTDAAELDDVLAGNRQANTPGFGRGGLSLEALAAMLQDQVDGEGSVQCAQQ